METNSIYLDTKKGEYKVLLPEVINKYKDNTILENNKGINNYDFSVFSPENIIKHTENMINSSTKTNYQSGLFRVQTANESIAEAKNQPIPRSLYKHLIYESELIVLFADTGVGKSIFAVQMANEMAKTDKVLYFDLELSDKQFQSRYSENYENEFIFNNNLHRISFERQVKIPDGTSYDRYFIDNLKQTIDNTTAKIVIIDNMTKLISGDTDKASSAKPLMDLLNDLKFDYNLTLILLEHTRKTDNNRPISLNDLQGSKMKANFADACFSIGRSCKNKNTRYIKQLKCRSAEIEYDTENVPIYEIVKENSFLHFKFKEYDTEYNHIKQRSRNEIDTEKAELINKVKEYKNNGLSERDIAVQLSISRHKVRTYLQTNNNYETDNNGIY